MNGDPKQIGARLCARSAKVSVSNRIGRHDMGLLSICVRIACGTRNTGMRGSSSPSCTDTLVIKKRTLGPRNTYRRKRTTLSLVLFYRGTESRNAAILTKSNVWWCNEDSVETTHLRGTYINHHMYQPWQTQLSCTLVTMRNKSSCCLPTWSRFRTPPSSTQQVQNLI